MTDNTNQTSQKLHSKERGTEIASYGMEGREVAQRGIVAVLGIIVTIIIIWALLSEEQVFNFKTIVAIFLPFLLLGGGAYLILPIIRAKMMKRNTVIYSNGIARNNDFIAWKDIDGIMGNFTKIRVNFLLSLKYGAFTLYQNSQPIFKIAPFDARPEQQYQHINQALIRTHLDELVKTIEAGGTLEFQPVTVKADGLHFDDKHLPMTEIGKVAFEGHQIQILSNKGKNWKFFLIEKFYNPYVFQALVYTLMKKAVELQINE